MGGNEAVTLPKQSAPMLIASAHLLRDHVAPQQTEDSPMLRWDTLLVAVAVAGGSMLIESSHRVDTGAPDDEVVATAPADCTVVHAAYRDVQADERSEVQSDTAPPVPAACSDQ
jgi:hypothetical protein